MSLALNTFLSALSDVCREHPLRDKWLFAPSRRIGYQWKDAVARAGQPVVNLHLHTISRLARDLIEPEVERAGRSFAGPWRTEVSLARIVADSLRGRAGYFSRLRLGSSLYRATARTIQDLRMSGLVSSSLRTSCFEVRSKGQEMHRLMQSYEEILSRSAYVDEAGALQQAAEIAASGRAPVPPDVLVLVPEDHEWRPLEERFFDSIQAEKRILPVDQAMPFTDDDHDDLSLLRWMSSPAGAPQPRGDGGVRLFTAIGVEGEVREVLRRCVQDGIALDDVEILHTDRDAYVPAIYEQVLRMSWGDDDLPATFAEGLPARYFRPGRALLAWLVWMQGGSQRALLERVKKERLLQKGSTLHTYDAGPESSQVQVLEAALRLLEDDVNVTSKKDGFCRKELLNEVRGLAEGLRDAGDLTGFDPWEWLAGLPREVRVGGLGPRAGRIHVAGYAAGGHGSRRHTFIIGLDDSRFPGTGIQDPLLLDSERFALSENLSTAAGILAKKVEGFHRMLARLRGSVTFSFSRQSLEDDREMYPCSAFHGAYRLATGDPACDQETMLLRLGPPSSFAPGEEARSLHVADWWLWRLCVAEPVDDPVVAVCTRFEHLGQGHRARLARESDAFTEFDGYVKDAALSPESLAEMTLSAGRLEMLANCPMEYFFRYHLEIKPPPAYDEDPGVWLDPATKGALLHRVFREFLNRLKKLDEPPGLDRHWRLLQETLTECLAEQRRNTPPPSRRVFELEREEMEEVVRIFLRDEEEFARVSQPVCLEASVGLAQDGEATLLDSPDPVPIVLPGGQTIRLRGRVDRVDEDRHQPGRYCIWDYKTGSAWKYTQDPPFFKGRTIQNVLYAAMVQARLHDAVSTEARVATFGYYFPTRRERGERIAWDVKRLAGGLQLVGWLCGLLIRGCFPFSDRKQDATYSEYEAAFGHSETTAKQTKAKLTNLENRVLDPFRRLRNYPTAEPGEGEE